MINREVKYERNITGSFIKIPSSYQGEFDENLMLRKKLQGLVPVEKCFYNQMGQYWYNITGMQPLETRCQVRSVDYRFIQKLLLRICEQLELMELNMFSPEILILDPEYIYLSNSTQEIFFVIYPGTEGDIMKNIRQLMDYLLVHIDHSNVEEVQEIYRLYELILNNACTIADIKKEFEHRQEEKLRKEIENEVPQESTNEIVKWEKDAELGRERPKMRSTLEVLKTKMLSILKIDFGKRDKPKESEEYIVYPVYDEETCDLGLTTPTICISTPVNRVVGKLKYEGDGDFRDISIEESEVRIGKGESVDVKICHDTISRIHARVTVEDNDYYIEDLNSTNGTYLNDEMLPFRTKRKLKQNDVVKFAEITYRFV